jgi:hypothetical protein
VLVGTVSMPCSASADICTWFAALDQLDSRSQGKAKRGLCATESAGCKWQQVSELGAPGDQTGLM